jgi:hypothetical protein
MWNGTTDASGIAGGDLTMYIPIAALILIVILLILIF